VQATSQVAQTSLRSVIGRADLDTLLSDRARINAELRDVIDAPTEEWGIVVERVEIKDISLPESMRRSMSRQAEAERDRRARVIAADGELQASGKLSEAAGTMSDTPGALQLRLLQTVTDVAAEKNSTLVMPFPVELLRFFEKATGGQTGAQTPASEEAGQVERAHRNGAVVPVEALPDVAVPGSADVPEPAATPEPAAIPEPVDLPEAPVFTTGGQGDPR
jgi:hypothetical protein